MAPQVTIRSPSHSALPFSQNHYVARESDRCVVRVALRAFLHKGFLTDAECDHLIALVSAGGWVGLACYDVFFDWLIDSVSGRFKAKDKLEKSMVADNESGKSVQSEVRTSSGMFLEKKQVSRWHLNLFHFIF